MTDLRPRTEPPVSTAAKASLWARFRCVFNCKGVYIYPLMGSGLDVPCPRCGRTRYIG